MQPAKNKKIAAYNGEKRILQRECSKKFLKWKKISCFTFKEKNILLVCLCEKKNLAACTISSSTLQNSNGLSLMAIVSCENYKTISLAAVQPAQTQSEMRSDLYMYLIFLQNIKTIVQEKKFQFLLQVT